MCKADEWGSARKRAKRVTSDLSDATKYCRWWQLLRGGPGLCSAGHGDGRLPKFASKVLTATVRTGSRIAVGGALLVVAVATVTTAAGAVATRFLPPMWPVDAPGAQLSSSLRYASRRHAPVPGVGLGSGCNGRVVCLLDWRWRALLGLVLGHALYNVVFAGLLFPGGSAATIYAVMLSVAVAAVAALLLTPARNGDARSQ